MAEAISLCWIAMEMASEFLFCECFLQRRKWNCLTYVVISSTLLGLYLYSNYCNGLIPTAYIAPVIYFSLLTFCYEGSCQRRLLSVIMCSLLITVIDALVSYICSIVFQIGIEDIRMRKYTYFSVGTISKTSSLLFAWLFYHFLSRTSKEQLQIRWLVLTLLFPIISYFSLIIIYRSYRFESDISTKGLGVTLVIAAANIGTMYTINQIKKSERNSQRLALLNQQMDIQTQSILGLEKSYRSQRAATHDFVHHLNTIGTLLDKKQYEIADQYIRRLQGQQTTRIFAVNSHHPVVDAVLNQEYQIAKERGIDMQVRVSDLSEIQISPERIVVVLSNLLDNAIEACERYSGERIIQFSFVLTDKLMLSIRNTTNPVLIKNGIPRTTKHDKQNHGFGLMNVERILDDLKAEHVWRYQDSWFCFVAEIPIS